MQHGLGSEPQQRADLTDRHRYREPGNRAVGLGLHLKRLRIHHAHTCTFRCVPQRTTKPGTQAGLRVQPGALVADSLDVGGGGKAAARGRTGCEAVGGATTRDSRLPSSATAISDDPVTPPRRDETAAQTSPPPGAGHKGIDVTISRLAGRRSQRPRSGPELEQEQSAVTVCGRDHRAANHGQQDTWLKVGSVVQDIGDAPVS